MREIKRSLAALMVFAVALAVVPAAQAHPSPAGCSGTPPTVSFSDQTTDQLKVPSREGDAIALGARVSNRGESSCDLSALTVKVLLPGPDGSLSNDRYRTLISDASLESGGTMTSSAAVDPYIVDLNEKTFEAPLQIHWQALVHNAEGDGSESGQGEVSVRINRPQSTLKVRSRPASGAPPLTVASLYELTNTSPGPANDPGHSLVAPGLVPAGSDGPRDLITDEGCGSVAYLSGDLDGSTARVPTLDPGETWRFLCFRTYFLPGTYSSQPLVTGTSSVDLRPWPQPAGGNDNSSVEVLGSDLTVSKSHRGDFMAGERGEYSVRVTNSGNQSTSGVVSVTDVLPRGLSAAGISGKGWTCVLASLSCSRSDPLPSGSSYPEVRVRVRVKANPPASVTNLVSVEGGGESSSASENNSAADPTTIRDPAQPQLPTGSRFMVGKPRIRNNGTAAIPVTVPTRGRLRIDDASGPDLVRGSTRQTSVYGSYILVVKVRSWLFRKLKQTGQTRTVRLKITFKPRGGKRSTRHRRVQFRVR